MTTYQFLISKPGTGTIARLITTPHPEHVAGLWRDAGYHVEYHRVLTHPEAN